MKKEDVALFLAAITTVIALVMLGYETGRNEAEREFERQAIHRGLATYDEKGEFQWIKK